MRASEQAISYKSRSGTRTLCLYLASEAINVLRATAIAIIAAAIKYNGKAIAVKSGGGAVSAIIQGGLRLAFRLWP